MLWVDVKLFSPQSGFAEIGVKEMPDEVAEAEEQSTVDTGKRGIGACSSNGLTKQTGRNRLSEVVDPKSTTICYF